MSNKLYEENNIRAIADAIRAKGVSGTMTVAQMPSKVASIPTGIVPEKTTYTQVNTIVSQYVSAAESAYNPNDYTNSIVDSYASQTTSYIKDEPFGTSESLDAGDLIIVDETSGRNIKDSVTSGQKTIYNITPSTSGGMFANTVNGEIKKVGTLFPTGVPRMIYAPSLGYGYQGGSLKANVRDIGGWQADGGTVKFNRIIRGGQPDLDNGGAITISDADKKTLVDFIGVRKEIDLRAYDRGASSLGTAVKYEHYPYSMYSGAIVNTGMQAIFKQIFESLVESAKRGEAVYIHCEMGNDRTGTVCFLIEALLGMSRADIDIDYELSTFAHYGTASKNRNASTWTGMISAFESNSSGVDYQHRAANYLERIGVSINDINAFRQAMIDGTPQILPSTAYTNLFDKATMRSGQRLNSGGALEANASYNVSNDMSFNFSDGATHTVRIKGASLTATDDKRVTYSANGSTWTGTGYIKNMPSFAYDTVHDTVSFTVTSTTFQYFRFSFPSTNDGSNIIVTVDEAID